MKVSVATPSKVFMGDSCRDLLSQVVQYATEQEGLVVQMQFKINELQDQADRLEKALFNVAHESNGGCPEGTNNIGGTCIEHKPVA